MEHKEKFLAYERLQENACSQTAGVCNAPSSEIIPRTWVNKLTSEKERGSKSGTQQEL